MRIRPCAGGIMLWCGVLWCGVVIWYGVVLWWCVVLCWCLCWSCVGVVLVSACTRYSSMSMSSGLMRRVLERASLMMLMDLETENRDETQEHLPPLLSSPLLLASTH